MATNRGLTKYFLISMRSIFVAPSKNKSSRSNSREREVKVTKMAHLVKIKL